MGKLNNFVVRAISGVVMAALLFGAIWGNHFLLVAIFMLIGVGGYIEYTKMVSAKYGNIIEVAFSSVIALQVFWLLCGHVQSDNLVYIIILFVLVRAAAQIFSKKEGQFIAIPIEFMGIVYAVIPMALLARIGDPYMITALILSVWANDVGAYLVGVKFGKHRMIERISPKKSWEGFAGGLFFAAVVGGSIFHYLVGYEQWLSALVALLIALAAVVGDLFESMLKRNIGVKDSGNIIPGHGGILDRFDALLFAAPLFYIINHVIELFS